MIDHKDAKRWLRVLVEGYAEKSLLVSGTAHAALAEIERLEAKVKVYRKGIDQTVVQWDALAAALVIAMEALENIGQDTQACQNWTGRMAQIDELARAALAKIKGMK